MDESRQIVVAVLVLGAIAIAREVIDTWHMGQWWCLVSGSMILLTLWAALLNDRKQEINEHST